MSAKSRGWRASASDRDHQRIECLLQRQLCFQQRRQLAREQGQLMRRQTVAETPAARHRATLLIDLPADDVHGQRHQPA